MSGETENDRTVRAEKEQALWRNFADKEYRDGFVEAWAQDSLAVQIYSMRIARKWSQEVLATQAGVRTCVVRNLEDSGKLPSLGHLIKIASAFDVALTVRFVPFSEFVTWDGRPIDRHIRSFEEDSLHDH